MQVMEILNHSLNRLKGGLGLFVGIQLLQIRVRQLHFTILKISMLSKKSTDSDLDIHVFLNKMDKLHQEEVKDDSDP